MERQIDIDPTTVDAENDRRARWLIKMMESTGSRLVGFRASVIHDEAGKVKAFTEEVYDYRTKEYIGTRTVDGWIHVAEGQSTKNLFYVDDAVAHTPYAPGDEPIPSEYSARLFDPRYES